MRLPEGVFRTAVGGGGDIAYFNGIENFAVYRQFDALLVPGHAPDVKFLSPLGVAERVERPLAGIPLAHPALPRAPAGIGEDVSLVIFHQVDFAAARPLAFDAQKPDRRPQSFLGS